MLEKTRLWKRKWEKNYVLVDGRRGRKGWGVILSPCSDGPLQCMVFKISEMIICNVGVRGILVCLGTWIAVWMKVTLKSLWWSFDSMLIFYVILFNFRLNEREANRDKPRIDLGIQDQDIRYEPITNVPELKHQFYLLFRCSFSSRASRAVLHVWAGSFFMEKSDLKLFISRCS